MLPYNQRLSRKDFETVYRSGKRLNKSLFLVIMSAQHGAKPQFSAVVSKKVAKSSVERHKIKRRIYEGIRAFLKKHPTFSSDVIFITYPAIKNALFIEILSEITQVLTAHR